MVRKDLKNKPLVEAIFELRWLLPNQKTPGVADDPHYRVLLGRFSERVQKEYPFHEPLPAASVPDNMVPQIVQHRFRVKEVAWPLVQMGPGIMTVNDTSSYTWADFQKRCETAISWLTTIHPDPTGFKVQDLTLRYIDAILFDFGSENIFRFLHDKMKISVVLPDTLFGNTKVSPNPTALNWHASFKLEEPQGTVTIRFASGIKEGIPALIWETLVQSAGNQLPDICTEFPKWLDAVHNITDDWFFKLIEGELERKFSGE